MRILTNPLGNTLNDKLRSIGQIEADGFAGAWLPSMGHDAMTVLALAGPRTERIELGTYVVPTYTRHPVPMAQQALATQIASGGRFTLGLGLSHQVVIEDSWGLDFSRPVGHMREYLSVLQPLLRGEQVDFEGEHFRVHSQLEFADAQPISLIVAALGPQMLRVAGRLADGTALWLAGPKWIEQVVIPEMGGGAREAGKPQPRVIAGVPVALTTDAERARERIGRAFAMYNTLPSYQRVIQGSGGQGPADLAIVGSEEEVELELRRWRDVGVTDFYAACDGATAEERSQTRSFMAALAPEL